MDNYSENIVATEVETFFAELEGSVSVSIVNLGEYPIQYYTSKSSLTDLEATDVPTHFAQELTNLIHEKTKDSKYKVSVTTHFFQYIRNHYRNDEEALKIVVDNLIRSDLIVFLSQGVNETFTTFKEILQEMDSTVLHRGMHLASMFSFGINRYDWRPLIYNSNHIRSNEEFDFISTLLEVGFVFPSEAFFTILHAPDNKSAVDVITRTMDGGEFYNDDRQLVFKKIMRFLLSTFRLLNQS